MCRIQRFTYQGVTGLCSMHHMHTPGYCAITKQGDRTRFKQLCCKTVYRTER